jgi:hypothetical protein
VTVRFRYAFLILALAMPGRAALPALGYFGALQGDITPKDLPALHWTLTAAAPANGKQSANFELIGDGLHLSAKVDADAATGGLSWEIVEGRIQLGTWFSALAARYAPALADSSVTGELILAGRGGLVDLKPVGEFSVSCPDASVKNATQGWALDGFSFAGDFALAPGFAVKSSRPFALGIRTITTNRLGARSFSLSARLENIAGLFVESARIEIAGGEVDAYPFTLPLSPLSVETRLRIQRVGLQDFAQLIPSGLADIRGRIGGELRLRWTEATGIKLGVGHLEIDEVEPTVFSLAPSPGLLTSSIPARIEFLPGRIGRWLSFRNEGYDDLHAIEMGRTPLKVNSLKMQLTPDGDDQGRSAHVEIEATPQQPDGAVQKVSFTVNVAGPLSALLNLGMNQNFTTELH